MGGWVGGWVGGVWVGGWNGTLTLTLAHSGNEATHSSGSLTAWPPTAPVVVVAAVAAAADQSAPSKPASKPCVHSGPPPRGGSIVPRSTISSTRSGCVKVTQLVVCASSCASASSAAARRGRRAPSLRGGGCHGREQVGTDWRVGRCAGRAGRRASIAPPNLRRQPATSRPATRRPTPSRTCHRGAGIQRVGQQGGEKSARQVTSKT